MKRFWIEGLLGAALVVAGVGLFTTPSSAKPAYLTAEKKKDPAVKNCAYCHVTNGSKALNPTGECYGKDKKHSLEGCPVPAAPKPAAGLSQYLAELDHAHGA